MTRLWSALSDEARTAISVAVLIVEAFILWG